MIVGTAGHVDHGKTSLVKALTGVDADRLKEEKERGITIDLGFAYWPQDDGGVIGFVDVPGHERFVHTMLAGAQALDLVLLVVAADDGVMPQTREHAEIVRLLGIDEVVVALTKVDAVDAARRAAVTAEIAAWLAEAGFAGGAILPVSSVTGEGVAELAALLSARHRALRARDASRLFRLSVDRAFVLQGTGVVVTGMALDGSVSVGDAVVVSPAGHEARVRSIHAQNRKAETGVAGQRCALNLAGPAISRETVARGDMVVAPAAHAPAQRIDAVLVVASGAAKGLTQWMPARLHHGTAEVGARIVLLDAEAPTRGETVLAQLVLERPICARAQDRFVLRDVSASRTLAGGRFLDLRAPERRRRAPERLALLAALAEAGAEGGLRTLLERAAGAVDLAAWARDAGVPLAEARARAQAAGAVLVGAEGGVFAVSGERLDALSEALRGALADFHAAHPDLGGQGLERLRMQAARAIPAALFRLLLRRFAEQGWLAVDGNWVRLASHRVEVPPEDAELWTLIRPLIAGEVRFRPPRVRDIADTLGIGEEAVRRVLLRLARAGEADEVAHDHFLLRPAVAEAVDMARRLEEDAGGWFVAAQFRDRLEAACGGVVGRKVAIQVLEFLDRHGVTIRRGDKRRINPHRRELFAVAEGSAPGDTSISGREASPVGRPDFKSGWGRETVSGGFDSHSLPPPSPRAAAPSPATGGGRG